MSLTLVDFVKQQEPLFIKAATDERMVWAKESQFAIQLFQNNDYLAKVAFQNQTSTQNAIINVAAIGISLNPAQKLAYLVPRKGANQEAIELAEAWGFTVRTMKGFTWVKLNQNAELRINKALAEGEVTDFYDFLDLLNVETRMNGGNHTRANTEDLLIATRGAGLASLGKSVRHRRGRTTARLRHRCYENGGRMTPANENAIRAACRCCTEEIQQAMRKKPKPNWNETVPPIINKHHKKIEALGVSLLEFVVYTGRLNRRFGVES
nr:hypothetical protein [Enterobacter hormaechei]